MFGDEDRLSFGADIILADLGFERSGDDLLITIVGTDDSIRVKDEFRWDNGFTWRDVEHFDFADGASLTKQQVQQILLAGSSGNDILVGFKSDDVLAGGTGDDLLQGIEGSDTYVYNVGDGDDVVEDYVYYWGSSGDKLVLGAGILPTDVVVEASSTNPSDLILTFGPHPGSVTIKGQILGGREWGIELIEFADSTVWTAQDLANLLTSSAGTDGDDIINGTSLPDILFGGLGNDTINAAGGNDLLNGGGATTS
jgi:Ca2+-binding RTX toxin-like protein